jgi:hypothetical protein
MAKAKGSAKTGGRQPGTPNKIQSDLKELIQRHGPELIDGLLKLVRDPGTPPAAKVAATKELMDRGYGKPAQSVAVTGQDGGPVEQVIQVITGVPR